MLKRILALATAAVMLQGCVYADYIIFSGKTEPGRRVSVMLAEEDMDFGTPNPSKIKGVTVAKADGDGNYRLRLKVDNVRTDGNGKIIGYAVNSNIDGLDIDSAELTHDSDWEIVIDGSLASFENGAVYDGGVFFVPLEETFAALGVKMTETNGVYTGKGANGDIKVTMGSSIAEVDWVDIELAAAPRYIGGVAMVPADIVEDALKTSAPVYDFVQKTVNLKAPDKDAHYEEEFDIAKAVKVLGAGTVIMTPDYVGRSYASGGSEYQRYSVDYGTNTATLTTLEYKYGEIPAPGNIQRSIGAGGDLKAGEVAVLYFKARATQTTDESGKATANVVYERAGDWLKGLDETISVNSGDWQEFYLPIYNAFGDFDVDGDKPARLNFKIGAKPQSIEIKDLTITSYGTSVDISTLKPDTAKPYKGMEDDALWRKQAYKRIEKYRKGDVSVHIQNENGEPVSGVKLNVKQTENEFMFGLAICKNEILGFDPDTNEGKIKNDVVNNSFNTMVCGMEMKAPSVKDTDGIDAVEMANEFFARGKRMRGHALMWDGEKLWPFRNYMSMSYDELYRSVMESVLPTVYMFRGKIAQWDVLNEPYSCNYIRNKYGTRLYSDVFKAVRKIDPSAKLYVNETGIEGKPNADTWDRIPGFLEIIKQMKSEGAPIDGIGIQAHCINYYYPQGFYHQIDECAQLVDEVAVTEYDFRNENEDYAAQHLRDMLLATFSHPKATAFTIWGYQDTMHWRNSAPFYDRSWNEKPAKAMWDKMVNGEFKTNTDITSDSRGNMNFRGFYGDYEITASYGGQRKKIPFRLTRDTEGWIGITVSEGGIFAEVSAEPKENIAPIEFSTVKEAKAELESIMPKTFESIAIESNFSGAMLLDGVKNGFVLKDNADYMNGSIWGSEYGMGDAASDSKSGIVLRSGSGRCADLRRRIAEKIYSDGSVELSFKFSTFKSKSTDTKTEIGFDTKVGEVLLAAIENKDGYALQMIDGAEAALDKNGVYELFICLEKVEKSGIYTIKYRLNREEETLLERCVGQNGISDISEISGVMLRHNSGSGAADDFAEFMNARVRFYTDAEILLFTDPDYSGTVLDESMEDFDTEGVKPFDSENGRNGSEWGFTGENAENAKSAFEYRTNMHYLWALRHKPAGRQSLAKKFAVPIHGETLKIEFDFYINAKKNFYDSAGSAALAIGSGDREIQRSLVKFRYTPTAYTRQLLEKADGSFAAENRVPSWDSNDVNRNTAHFIIEIIPTEDGYKAVLNVRSEYGNEQNEECKLFLNADEIEKLDTLFLVSETEGIGTEYGSAVAGVKNIKITKYGVTAEKDSQGHITVEPSACLSIGYDNITRRKFSAKAVVGGYKDGRLTSADIYDFSDVSGKEGSLSFEVKDSGADTYRVFLIDGFGELKPYNKAADIWIKK